MGYMIIPKHEHFSTKYREFFVKALKQAGITPPARVKSNRAWIRFMEYAMKRADSDHPQDKNWKPLVGVYLAAQIAEKLA